MEFYATSKGCIVPADLEIFNKIAKVLCDMPDLVFDPNEKGWDFCKNQLSCHLICRALADCFKVSVRDGYFTVGYQHSWLVPESKLSIIDAYPVASVVPFIVATDRFSPWKKLYNESDSFQSMFTTSEFCDRLEKTKRMVSETVRCLESPNIGC